MFDTGGRERKLIHLMITDAGGGHRSTAASLKEAIESSGLPWNVRIVNIYKEVWHKHEISQYVIRCSGEDIYNRILRHNLTGWVKPLRRLAYNMIQIQKPIGIKVTREFFLREKPDLVVSIMPMVNDIFAEALEGSGIPIGLIFSDLVDMEPPMWLTPSIVKQARFVAVGSELAARQVREADAGSKLINCGLVINPKFFSSEFTKLTKLDAKDRLHLDSELFTVMIFMGGYGSRIIRSYIERFEASKDRWQIIACCGRNEKLYHQLCEIAPILKNKVIPIGYSDEINILMRAADVLITKPGPASIMEAIASQTPVVLDNVRTMPQERPNVEFIKANALGLSVSRRHRMFRTIEHLASDISELNSIKSRMEKHTVHNASPIIINAMSNAMN